MLFYTLLHVGRHAFGACQMYHIMCSPCHVRMQEPQLIFVLGTSHFSEKSAQDAARIIKVLPRLCFSHKQHHLRKRPLEQIPQLTLLAAHDSSMQQQGGCTRAPVSPKQRLGHS